MHGRNILVYIDAKQQHHIHGSRKLFVNLQWIHIWSSKNRKKKFVATWTQTKRNLCWRTFRMGCANSKRNLCSFI